ncbi:MAG: D-glycero-beta-D-manno-heptose 1,7-bisphosphate 7-phosphatase [Proteobacteria bacterium]|nr:D-glycero-beta-D-manno-heptose 1,7-bisphosphate 7-phosphatase [Pseudomonadota bacterium]
MASAQKRIAVFLDRDGTVNEDAEYLSDPNELKLIPGSGGAIRLINEAGLLAVVLTNQSGVARGYFSETQVGIVNKRLDLLLAQNQAKIDAYYYCPHHPTEGNAPYRVECDCRKPKTGMIKKAVKKLDIDPQISYMVGDKLSDLKMADAAGAKGILVRTGYGRNTELDIIKEGFSQTYKVSDNLLSAVHWILEDIKK